MEKFRLSQTKMELIEKTWQELANELNGSFKKDQTTIPAAIEQVFIDIQSFELKIPFLKDNEIIIHTSEYHPLRISFLFHKEFDFNFMIYPEGIIEKISKFFGAKEVEIGIEEFDHKFILKSNNEENFLSFLDERIRLFLLETKFTSLLLRDKENLDFEFVLTINEESKEEMLHLIDFVKYCINRIEALKNK